MVGKVVLADDNASNAAMLVLADDIYQVWVADGW